MRDTAVLLFSYDMIFMTFRRGDNGGDGGVVLRSPSFVCLFVFAFENHTTTHPPPQGVEKVASAAASLTAAGDNLPKQALRLLSAAKQDAVALCEAMARLDQLLAVRERAQMARRRTLEEEERRGGGGVMSGGTGGALGRGVRR